MRKKHNLFHYIFTIFYILFKSLVSSFVWILVGIAGLLIYQARKTPYDIVLGIPLMLIGGGFVVNNLGDILQAIFSPTYNKGICIFCSR